MYDLAIIGGGPAGVAAGVYAARKRLKTIFITKEWGGQSNVSGDIQNWIGTASISGLDLAKNLKNHLETYKADAVEIKEGAKVNKIEKVGEHFTLSADNGSFVSRAVLIASGSERRRLQVEGADKFEHKGLTYCASCDGPLFADMDVAVIGGGNAAFETAAQLLAYCKSVTLLNRSGEFRADPVTVEKVLKSPKIHAVRNAEPTAVLGDKFVTGLRYKDKDSGEEKELPVSGIFVEIGLLPNTGLAKGLVQMDEIGRIEIDPKTGATSQEGVWAAGDCTDTLYHQNNIAAGDAVRALEDIYLHLHTK
ncbi:MAG: FAD-dependent oxidoreductase [Patescibacteria group bacterium]